MRTRNAFLLALACLACAITLTISTSAFDNPKVGRARAHMIEPSGRVLIIELPEHMLDAKWASGGVCSSGIDCALSGQNFCASHGGVRITMHDADDTTDLGCLIICRGRVDGSPVVGHLTCNDDLFDSTDDDEEDEQPPTVGDECDPDFIGPPNPDLDCSAPCVGDCA